METSSLFLLEKFLKTNSLIIELDSYDLVFLWRISIHQGFDQKDTFYSQNELSRECGMKNRKLRMVINKLLALQLIESYKLGRFKYNYVLSQKVISNLENLDELEGRHIMPHDRHIMPHDRHIMPHDRHIMPQSQNVQSDLNVYEVYKKDIYIKDYKKTKEKNKKKKIKKVPTEEICFLPDWLDTQDWADFLNFRKEIKSPMSIIAQKRAISTLNKLKEQGNNPSEVINQSIVSGWKGLFTTQGQKYGYARQERKSEYATGFDLLLKQKDDARRAREKDVY